MAGDAAEARQSGGRHEIGPHSWTLMHNVADYHPACAEVLRGLVEGLAASCGRGIAVRMHGGDDGRPPFSWTVG